MTKAFIFIGPSGSGKGTQAGNLTEHIHKTEGAGRVFYVESGEKFREFIQGDRYLEKLSRERYESGERQPDFLAVHIWSHILINEFSGEKHIIFDGTPRSLNEARILDTALSFLGITDVFIISLSVGKEWSHKRLSERGRLDDDPYGIEKRLAWFSTDVVPAIEYYKNHNKHTFIEVNGEQEKKQVWEDIKSQIS